MNTSGRTNERRVIKSRMPISVKGGDGYV